MQNRAMEEMWVEGRRHGTRPVSNPRFVIRPAVMVPFAENVRLRI